MNTIKKLKKISKKNLLFYIYFTILALIAVIPVFKSFTEYAADTNDPYSGLGIYALIFILLICSLFAAFLISIVFIATKLLKKKITDESYLYIFVVIFSLPYIYLMFVIFYDTFVSEFFRSFLLN